MFSVFDFVPSLQPIQSMTILTSHSNIANTFFSICVFIYLVKLYLSCGMWTLAVAWDPVLIRSTPGPSIVWALAIDHREVQTPAHFSSIFILPAVWPPMSVLSKLPHNNVSISFCCCLVTQRHVHLCSLWTIAQKALLSMGILWARILEWMPFSPPGDLLTFPAWQILHHWAPLEALDNPLFIILYGTQVRVSSLWKLPDMTQASSGLCYHPLYLLHHFAMRKIVKVKMLGRQFAGSPF